jgi:nitrate reductase gamma subunit
MDGLSVFYVIFAYLASVVFLIGFLAKVWMYGATPSPLKIPTTPAPVTRFGTVLRIAQEVVFFRSLFKGNRLTWIGGYVFHICLLIVLISHLRYFFDPVPQILMSYQVFFQSMGHYAGHVLLLALLYLLFRRLTVDRTFYVSILSDYFILILLFCIGLTGILLKYVARPDLVSVKSFILGLISFKPVPVPHEPMFLAHLTLVFILLIYFPFSKLMHAGGVFFSPTRYQVDNPREKRYVNPWAEEVN